MPVAPLNVLSNTPLPELKGFSIRHFGDCFPPATKPAEYRPERERRSLREILAGLPAGFKPDLLLVRSPEYLPIPDDLDAFRGPRLLLITDWNVSLRFLPDVCRLFDACFTDAAGTRILRRAGAANVHHQPLFGHDPARFRDLGIPRDLDLSFCGNLNSALHAGRNRLVFLLAHWGRGRRTHLGQAFGEDYVRVLNRSRLVFDYSVRGEANMRLYEAMACGAVALVERGNEEVPLLFREGEHYLSYAPARLEEACDEALRDPDRLAAIGAAARKAVADQTQARQLERLLERAVEICGGLASSPVPRGGDRRGRKAARKMRLLGSGYDVAGALAEIGNCGIELPGIAAETMPGLLALFLENTGDSPAREKALALFRARLRDDALPPHFRSWFGLVLLRLEKKWERIPAEAEETLRFLDEAAASDARDPGYGFFHHPINLGLALNTDLNRCYRDFVETGSHAAYYALLRNLVLAEASDACAHEKRTEEAAHFASEMTPGNGDAVSPWPRLFNLCLICGDAAALPKVAAAWLDENPLDAGNWESILKGLQAVGSAESLRSFLDKIIPAAEHFLGAEKLAKLLEWERGAHQGARDAGVPR